jgi:hypothetical protein
MRLDLWLLLRLLILLDEESSDDFSRSLVCFRSLMKIFTVLIAQCMMAVFLLTVLDRESLFSVVGNKL